ncbi:maestro heat-like repeat-containing protein family member 7 isoform X1 [Agelaius phoeniceus]|uniref:maestro heat-like repeat-containing protein family member 7 isoform X1 n=1 Tax=Agelaius phoeniceus TaxID=39638 RepID=UPI0040550F9F
MQEMPEEVETFWKGCQEQHGLSAKPNSFALQTLKALLCQMRYEHAVLSMERKRAWDTPLRADTHHCTVGLLAREMCRVSIIWCCDMASRLFDLLSQGISDWELPSLAFLVEVLDCLDLSQCGEKVLEILTRHLQSESRQMRRVALRGLVGLTSMDPSMYSLTESLGKLLWDRDEDIVEMTLVVLSLLPL